MHIIIDTMHLLTHNICALHINVMMHNNEYYNCCYDAYYSAFYLCYAYYCYAA